MADRPTLADLAANPALAAEVALDRIPELLGEMERLRATLWARLALRINRPPGEDHLLVITDAAARLGSKEWLCRHGDRLPFRCCGSPAASSAPAWCLGTAYPCAARSPSSARGAVAGLWRPSASGKRKRRLPPHTSRRASDSPASRRAWKS